MSKRRDLTRNGVNFAVKNRYHFLLVRLHKETLLDIIAWEVITDGTDVSPFSNCNSRPIFVTNDATIPSIFVMWRVTFISTVFPLSESLSSVHFESSLEVISSVRLVNCVTYVLRFLNTSLYFVRHWNYLARHTGLRILSVHWSRCYHYQW